MTPDNATPVIQAGANFVAAVAYTNQREVSQWAEEMVKAVKLARRKDWY